MGKRVYAHRTFANRARQTHCKNGHALSGDNVYWRKDGRGLRDCMECRRAAERRRKRPTTLAARQAVAEANKKRRGVGL